MTKTKGTKGGAALAQPMDPTRSSEDFIGDTTGLTGFTTGSAKKTSSTPHDMPKDENKDHLPGGILQSQTTNVSGGRLSPNQQTDDEYRQDIVRGMSQVQRDAAEDTARENEISLHDREKASAHLDPNEDPYTVNKQDASPENMGEQSLSGSESDPTSDDDTLEAAHAVGTQLEEKMIWNTLKKLTSLVMSIKQNNTSKTTRLQPQL